MPGTSVTPASPHGDVAAIGHGGEMRLQAFCSPGIPMPGTSVTRAPPHPHAAGTERGAAPATNGAGAGRMGVNGLSPAKISWT